MPNTTVEVGAVQSFSYDDLMRWANLYSDGNIQQYIDTAATYGVGEEQALLDFLNQDGRGINVSRAADGSYQGWFYNNVEQVVQANPINSNASTVSRSSLRQMLGNRFEQVGSTITRHMTRFPVSGGLGQRASYVLGSVGSAYAAVSAGIWAGRTVSGALYDSNPDFFESIGWGGLNPEAWRILTEGSDSPYAGLLNMILGIDPDSGNSQMYMREDMLAYMLYGLNQAGFFGTGTVTPPTDQIYQVGQTYNITPTMTIAEWCNYNSNFLVQSTDSDYMTKLLNHLINDGVDVNSPNMIIILELYSSNNWICVHVANSVNNYTVTKASAYSYGGEPIGYAYEPFIPTTRYFAGRSNDGKIERNTGSRVYTGRPSSGLILLRTNGLGSNIGIDYQPAIDGIGTQPSGQMPDTSTWDSLDDVLPSIQQQYPDAFANPMIWDNDQPDGTHQQIRYIPVPIPDSQTGTNTQPTSGNQTQTNTLINPTTIPSEMLEQLTRLITAPRTQPETATEPQQPPANPVDTGTGTTVTPTPPVGNASALWSVYHPTQAQVNSFGGWLWGSPFLTNIGKLFENPIDGVISLHKIYAQPVDSGSGTIVVGTLDSQVPSATVNQQYVTVDCGSVSCQEDFGNVFDYPPFTKVSLYLPFVGIVPLDTNDVMRSTIHVVYGVDVFTGACIAMVEVSRDGNTINMYQYTGNCAVHYPLSNVQQSQLLSGLISVAAGVGSIVATGGASVPAVAGIVHGAATASNTSIGRSGGFSANAGAMGIKKPYIIIQRPQTKVAEQFTTLAGYPTNISGKLSDFSGQVNVTYVHVNGIPATREELELIKSLLKEGVEV